MRFYRIARAEQAGTALAAFSGEGAAKYPGRWNHRGVRAVYGADSLAVACLETLVHLRPLPRRFPPSVYFSIEIDPALLEQPPVAALPAGWDQAVVPNETRDFGTAFLTARRAVALLVPTTIIPVGLIAVVNPLHPRFSVASISGPHPFFYDQRLE